MKIVVAKILPCLLQIHKQFFLTAMEVVDQWKVVWSEESPYVLRCQNRSYVWRLREQQFSPRCSQRTLCTRKKSWYEDVSRTRELELL